MLICVTPQHDQVLRQCAERFPNKNRSTMYLPCKCNVEMWDHYYAKYHFCINDQLFIIVEKWRVHLKNVYPDYIHATFVHVSR